MFGVSKYSSFYNLCKVCYVILMLLQTFYYDGFVSFIQSQFTLCLLTQWLKNEIKNCFKPSHQLNTLLLEKRASALSVSNLISVTLSALNNIGVSLTFLYGKLVFPSFT